MTKLEPVIPRGVELLKQMDVVEEALQAWLGSNNDLMNADFSVLPPATRQVIFDWAIRSLNFAYQLRWGLRVLAARGFFDDNGVELATAILKQLGKK